MKKHHGEQTMQATAVEKRSKKPKQKEMRDVHDDEDGMLLLERLPDMARKAIGANVAGVGTGISLHLRSIIAEEMNNVASTTTTIITTKGGNNIPSLEDRAVFILKRKRDALHYFLTTCCARLANDIVLGDSCGAGGAGV